MYSTAWFEAFSPNSEAVTSLEVSAISRLCPLPDYLRLLELGCGSGRVAGPLARVGYDVVGLDISSEALRLAKMNAPGPRYVAMDQRDVGQLPWKFDCAIVLWNSIGFGTRENDRQTLQGVAHVLRPGGKLLIDLYHPKWLANQPDVVVKSRGAAVRRWVSESRCFHEIIYDNGSVDDIQFNVYLPDEMTALLVAAGFSVLTRMTWWSNDHAPAESCARYQLECVRHAAA